MAEWKLRHLSISRPYFRVSGLLTLFFHLIPFQSYSRFLFWLGIALGAEILGVLGILNLLMLAHINKTPKGTYLRQIASFEASCIVVRRLVRPVRDWEKIFF